jgi:lysine-specific demethylase 8
MSKWQNPQYFMDVAGLRTVPVEVGQHYLDDTWGQVLMPLGDFIINHVLQDPPLDDSGVAPSLRGSRALAHSARDADLNKLICSKS